MLLDLGDDLQLEIPDYITKGRYYVISCKFKPEGAEQKMMSSHDDLKVAKTEAERIAPRPGMVMIIDAKMGKIHKGDNYSFHRVVWLEAKG